jgi:hypothetical protein
MAARDADAPRYAYVLAVCVGLFALPAAFALVDRMAAGSLDDFITGAPVMSYRAAGVAAGLFALANAVLGAAFGLAWPEKSWRWGVWLCAVYVCLVSYVAYGLSDFLAWTALTLAPACLGAYAAGRLHLQYVAVDESG